MVAFEADLRRIKSAVLEAVVPKEHCEHANSQLGLITESF
jgi:hypothetical protein